MEPHLEPRLHRCRRDVLTHSPDDDERPGLGLGPYISTSKRVRHGQWYPEAHELLARQLRVRLRHADDFEALTSQRDSLADDRWIRLGGARQVDYQEFLMRRLGGRAE